MGPRSAITFQSLHRFGRKPLTAENAEGSPSALRILVFLCHLCESFACPAVKGFFFVKRSVPQLTQNSFSFPAGLRDSRGFARGSLLRADAGPPSPKAASAWTRFAPHPLCLPCRCAHG